ncbi:MAG TPA: SIMPL domain-containing protein [Bacteroidetes bacterium]|nr:SIMPL domain-containing protein [Bacteroidota bacterium]
MRRRQFNTVMAPVVAIVLFLVSPVQAQDGHAQHPSQVTVSGEGVISTAPDMATVQFAVVESADNPETARENNASASANALNAVRAMGVEEMDIQMQNLQINPMREYDPDRRTYNETGWEATRNLTVTIRNLDELPDLIASIVTNGANRMNSIQYGLDDRADLELEVLRLAVLRAKAKAETMATALGKEIGGIVTLNEHGTSVPRPVMRLEASFDMASAKGAPEPDAYASGQIEIRTSVTAVYFLK